MSYENVNKSLICYLRNERRYLTVESSLEQSTKCMILMSNFLQDQMKLFKLSIVDYIKYFLLNKLQFSKYHFHSKRFSLIIPFDLN
jgi:hypothetical protein